MANGIPRSRGRHQTPPRRRTLTLCFADSYRNLGRCFPEAVYKLAQEYPERTSGEFTILSSDGFRLAQTYRVHNGNLYRRSLDDAPEREVFLHRVKVRNGPSRELLLTEHELARMAVARKNGHHKHYHNGRR